MPQALPPESVPRSTVNLLLPLYRTVVRFHDYRVVGLEHIPEHGAAIIAFTHSLASFDIVLFGATVYFERKRLIASLADRAIFKMPGLKQAAQHVGAVEGEPDIARRILRAGRLLGVAPGGMHEALRPSEKKYQLEWARRTGFAKLAIETQTPVILAACPAADDLLEVVDNPVTRFIYDRFRLPAPLVVGVKRAKLVHLVSEPQLPPKDVRDVKDFQASLIARMEALIAEALLL